MFTPSFDPNALFSQIKQNYMTELQGLYNDNNAMKGYITSDMNISNITNQRNDLANQISQLTTRRSGLKKHSSVRRRLDKEIKGLNKTMSGITIPQQTITPNDAFLTRYNQLKAQGQIPNTVQSQPVNSNPVNNSTITTTTQSPTPRPTVYGGAVSRYLAKMNGGVV